MYLFSYPCAFCPVMQNCISNIFMYLPIQGSPGLFSQPSPPSVASTILVEKKKTKQTTLSWGRSQSKVDHNGSGQNTSTASTSRGGDIGTTSCSIRGGTVGQTIASRGAHDVRRTTTDAHTHPHRIEMIDDDDDDEVDIAAMLACVETLERNPATDTHAAAKRDSKHRMNAMQNSDRVMQTAAPSASKAAPAVDTHVRPISPFRSSINPRSYLCLLEYRGFLRMPQIFSIAENSILW